MIIPRRTEPRRVRVAAVDGAGRVLLVRNPEPDRSPGPDRIPGPDGGAGPDPDADWVLPGCPVERGESSATALERLLASLGVRASGPGRPVWHRVDETPRGGELVRRDEDVYLVLTTGEHPSREGETLRPRAELAPPTGIPPEAWAGAAAPRPGAALRPAAARPPGPGSSRPTGVRPRTGPLWK